MLTFHESKDPGSISPANDYLEDSGYSSLKRITGYYGDREFAEQTLEPALLTVTDPCGVCHATGEGADNHDDPCVKCDGEGRTYMYFPGYRCDDYHGKQEGVFDMADAYTDTDEAARSAHHIAKREAEQESECQEKERARMMAEETLPDEIRLFRRQHSRLIGAILKYRDGDYDNASCVRSRAELRNCVANNIKRIRELRSQFDFTDRERFLKACGVQ